MPRNLLIQEFVKLFVENEYARDENFFFELGEALAAKGIYLEVNQCGIQGTFIQARSM